MALTDQPYLPLYVDDWMNNSKLKLCTPGSHGLMISVMCLMHKSPEYGQLELKAKFKQNKSNVDNFADYLGRLTCFSKEELLPFLRELLDNEVLSLQEDILICKRMIKDGDISKKRASAGSEGGKIGRNSATKRYYNEYGFLYLISDPDSVGDYKVGISKDPEKRLKGIIRKTKRDNLLIIKTWNVDDMGQIEDIVLTHFDDIRDGEWIIWDSGNSSLIKEISTIVQNKSKTKANAGIGIGIEYNNISFKDKFIELSITDENTQNFYLMLVQEIIQVWCQINPEYHYNESLDSHAALQIAYQIANIKKWKKADVIEDKKNECIESWKKIANFIMSDSWFKKLTLDTISGDKMWQKIVVQMSSHKTVNGSFGGGDPDYMVIERQKYLNGRK